MLLLGALAALAACAPTGEIVLHVDTDAPVPAGPDDAPDPARGPALFDRLRIEVLRDGIVLPTAVRDFSVDAHQLAAGLVSVGIAPPIGSSAMTARVRLFRGDRLTSAGPPTGAVLDTTVRLPPIAADEKRDVTVRLLVEDVGFQRGQPDPIDPTPGEPGPSLVGTWPGAQRVACAGTAGPDEVCVPGGAYWMGDPLSRALRDGYIDADHERLVVVSPFFLQLHEVTVAEFRARFDIETFGRSPPIWNGLEDSNLSASYCSWTDAPFSAAHEALPINCVRRQFGEIYCGLIGAQLPTEAQLEFVASGLGEERGYVWGNDMPRCGESVFGLGTGDGALPNADPSCNPTGAFGGPQPGAGGSRDRIELDGKAIVDLAGNVAEYAADAFSEQDGPYWSRAGVFVDPLADYVAPDTDPQAVARGGSFDSPSVQLRAALRHPIPLILSGPQGGFRCARSGR